jgi:putative transposase
MPHSYSVGLYHCVFAAKQRRPLLNLEIMSELPSFLNGISHRFGMNLLSVGGIEDHIHALVELPAIMSLARAIKLLKGSSSRWIHERFAAHRDFAWQEGYGAFSIGISQKDRTIRYILNQKETHRHRTFEEEYKIFLIRHGLKWDDEIGE